MAIMAPMGGNNGFQVHPAGQFAAICVDVVDVGMKEVTFAGEAPKQVHKVDLYWFCDQYKTDDAGDAIADEDGNPVPLFVRSRYTLSSNETATLRKHLEGWYAKKFDNKALQRAGGFDVEKVLHRPCLLVVTHTEKGDQTYANVTGIMALPKGMDAPAVPDGYVRMQDRPPRDTSRPQVAQTPARAATRAPAKMVGNREPWPDEPPPFDDSDDSLPF